MTGPDHYAEAEHLLALAGRHSKGVIRQRHGTRLRGFPP